MFLFVANLIVLIICLGNVLLIKTGHLNDMAELLLTAGSSLSGHVLDQVSNLGLLFFERTGSHDLDHRAWRVPPKLWEGGRSGAGSIQDQGAELRAWLKLAWKTTNVFNTKLVSRYNIILLQDCSRTFELAAINKWERLKRERLKWVCVPNAQVLCFIVLLWSNSYAFK